MLNDFAKLETFLTVVREKSFSKASAKLGISQPAVTQQMKFIEDYLDVQIVDRKKNGIKLTKEGQILHSIALKIEKCVSNAEKDLLKIMNKSTTFVFGASFIIGNYILPRFLNNLKENIRNDVSINVSVSHEAIEDLLDKKIDIALVENYISNDDIIYREWMEDEIVIFSNQKLPTKAKAEDLLSYKWVCRNPESNTRLLFKDSLEKANYPDCDTFNVTSEVTSATTIVQTVLHSDKNDTPTVSIVSRNAIESLLKAGALYESRIGNQKMIRKLYIAYRKDRKHDAFIENVVDYLLKMK
ncbi:LysR family transcriptional regulator [Aliarcobacter cibarius]|jgi:LysR family transcriptional regulator, transcriptional activator of the cysJI operon|uniref:LysR family transcriptional regulator n=1 Tax=Aliarcobacter cibarius TaxID=255507 RepID=A0A5J6RF39_9BACT|nr:LysR family transcriptional regulator [Aliarcobacter cibarius]QEZ88415.1 transcriptional regulator, LysR family [Aliarcobacter cibarius]QKJ26425.1 transcriptional regulator, LysR family [Aliarcobacter cibarius]TLT01913.1 LysR family transcriptional regulator [Aliarcobacter cibarius]TLT02248.1 LysR family transcriptional regulator [Aliarcobacter cibarius]TLT04679.1 LysR family transcriptional regulator [Aliarcobacter cibarius]